MDKIQPTAPRVAVLLAGCGHRDGSEVREAVLTLLALDQQGAQVQCVAPNAAQAEVIDHSSGALCPDASRNMWVESGRIARLGQCADLASVQVADFDALLLPGGTGVAKNLCTWGRERERAQVRPDVAAFVGGFFDAGKPVGAVCIAPALVALVLAAQGRSARLTLGSGADGLAQALARLGQQHQAVPSAREVVCDPALRLASSAAYMHAQASLSDLMLGISATVAQVLDWVRAAPARA